MRGRRHRIDALAAVIVEECYKVDNNAFFAFSTPFMDPTYPLLPIANFISCILVLLPFLTIVVKSQTWNTGACMYAIWVFLLCLIRAVNSIIWSDNADVSAPIWCDITTHLDIACTVGIPACSLVITRQLYKITHSKNFIENKRKLRIELMIDLGICLLFPSLNILFYYFVQGRRFDIYVEAGCIEAFADEIGMTYLLIDSWKVLLPLISALFYCFGAARAFYRRARSLDILSNNASVNHNIYFRLMALGLLDVVFTLPVSTLQLTLNLLQGVPQQLWPGLSVVHKDLGTVFQYSSGSDDWRTHTLNNLNTRWYEWNGVLFAGVFFALFGLTAEAKERYRRTFWASAGFFGFSSRIVPETSLRRMDIIFAPGVIGSSATTCLEP